MRFLNAPVQTAGLYRRGLPALRRTLSQAWHNHGVTAVSNPLIPIALLILGSTGVISILLPYAAENYPVRVRGGATGWVAGCTKAGGLICQVLSVAAMVPTLGAAAIVIAVPSLLGLGLIAYYGRETRGRDLRELEVRVQSVPAS